MKQFLQLSLTAALLLTACGAPDNDASVEADIVDLADNEQTMSDREAWLMSDERPVNLACMEPGYDRGQPDIYVGLHSPLYPAITAKQEKLLQQLRDLTPTVTDEDMHDAEAYNEVKQKLSILSQFTFLMGTDLPPRTQFTMCDFDQYDSNQCKLMARMLGDDFAINDVLKEGESLRFATFLKAENIKVDMHVDNSDFDGVTMHMQGADFLQAEWTRARDGTERMESTGRNESYSYTENPDCSGRALLRRPRDNGNLWITSFSWTSARDDNFRMTYSDCKENDLGEQQCKAGGL